MHIPSCSLAMVLATACVTLLSLTTVKDGVFGAHHWMSTDNAGIVPKSDYLYRTNDGNPHLLGFLKHGNLMKDFRARLTAVEAAMFGAVEGPVDFQVIPDLLSNVNDYRRNVSGNTLKPLPTSCMLLAHKDVSIHDHLDLNQEVTEELQPTCEDPKHFTMGTYMHLPSMALHPKKKIPNHPEPALASIAWAQATDKNGVPHTQEAMGTLISKALQSNQSSWVLHNLAALYWRINGNSHEAIRCLISALTYSPHHARDMALLQIGNMLYVGESYDEALVYVEAALTVNMASYPAHYLHGTTTLALGDEGTAQQAFALAMKLQPELVAAFEINNALSSIMKEREVDNRRERTLIYEMATQILPGKETFREGAKFESAYQLPSDTCRSVKCVENAMCIPQVQPICVCRPGWSRSIDTDTCVVDKRCKGVQCSEPLQACFEGECRCRIGYHMKNGVCVKDLCSRIECIDNARCDRPSGRCLCVQGYVQRGATCVPASCTSVLCPKSHQICDDGKCICDIGYVKGNKTKGEDDSECFAYPKCTISKCPERSKCDPVDGICRCNDGFTARPDLNRCLGADELRKDLQPKMIVTDEDMAQMFWQTGNCKDHMRDQPDFRLLTTAIAMFPSSWDSLNKSRVQSFWAKSKKAVKTYKSPVCKAVKKQPANHDFNYNAMDHIEGIALRGAKSFQAAYPPQKKFLTVLQRLMGNTTLTQKTMGHLIATTLKKRSKNAFVFNVATLWWMIEGNLEEAINCVRASMMHSPLAEKVTPLVNAANIMTRIGRSHDAHILAQLAMDLAPTNDLVQYTLAIAKAASGRIEGAIEMLKANQNTSTVSRIALINHLQCYQLHKLMLNTHVVDSKPHQTKLGLLIENVEAQALYVKLLQERISLSILANEDTDEIWKEMRQSQKSMILLKERQLEQQRLVTAIQLVTEAMVTKMARPSKDAEKSTTTSRVRVERRSSSNSASSSVPRTKGNRNTREVKGADDKKVVVVQYPKSPSIPALISAVEDMLDGEMDLSLELPFDDVAWPHAESCAAITKPVIEETLQYPDVSHILFEKETMDMNTILWLHSTIDPDFDLWREPKCGQLENAKKAHTLEHLEGVAKKDTLWIPRQTQMEPLLKGSFKSVSTTHAVQRDFRTTLSMREAGERIHIALKNIENSWFVYQMAALYWQVMGKAPQAIECLQKAYYWSGPTRKDKSLTSLAYVLHLGASTVDAMTLVQMAIQVNPKKAHNHFSLGNLLVTFGPRGYEEAAFFYETAYRLNNTHKDAITRLLAVRCYQADAKQ